MKTSKTRLRRWKTAVSKRLDFIKNTTTDAKVTFSKKFDSAKLEVFDKYTSLTVYRIQFFETRSLTIQGNYVSQWCTFECVGLKQLVDKLEKSDSTLHEGIIRSNLLEPTWDNNWFQPASVNQPFSSTSPDETNVHKSIDHDQSEKVGLLPLSGTKPITITSTPIPILAETPNTHITIGDVSTNIHISGKRRQELLCKAHDRRKERDHKIEDLKSTVAALKEDLNKFQKQNKEMNVLINNQNEKINKLTGKINKIVSDFDSYSKTFQTVQKYVSENETIKKEFNLLKDYNESFIKSQLIDPCSLANLNQDFLTPQDDSTKLRKQIESVNNQLNSKVNESVSNMEEFLNKKIDEALKDSQFVTTNQSDLFKRDTDAKHTQIKSSCQELLERIDSKMQELSDNLSKVVSKLSIHTPKQTFAEVPKPQQNLLPHNIDITNVRPTNQSRPQRGMPPIAHPNASK